MYHVAVRALMRRNIARLNEGDLDPLLRQASPEIELSFPGDNSWSTMFRPVEKGRHRHVTHRGIDECRAFGERFVAEGLQIVIEDIVVAGPPWRTRVALRAHDYQMAAERDAYTNRYLGFLTIRWGRLVEWEVYEDTERTAAWDAAQLGAGA